MATITPYSVKCYGGCGRVCLSQQNYRQQMWAADSLWACPQCGSRASWSDPHYDDYQDLQRIAVEAWGVDFRNTLNLDALKDLAKSHKDHPRYQKAMELIQRIEARFNKE